MFGFEKKKTVVINVNGMHCSHCAAKVSKVVSSLDGVSKVSVDLDAKSVSFTCKESFDTAKACEAINAAGFEVVS